MFIGKLHEIDTARINMSRGYLWPVNIYQFEVIKIGKGLDENCGRISVLDFYESGSCDDLFFRKQVGDTILVFGEIGEIGQSINFVLSNDCYHNLVLKNYNIHDSIQVVNSLNWTKPIDTGFLYTHEKEKPSEATNKINQPDNKPTSGDWKIILMIISLSVNVLLYMYIQRKKRR